VPVRVKRVRRTPAILSYGANNLIVITCTILFFASILFSGIMIDYLALDPVKFIFMPWQLVTSIFLHVEPMHFFINTLVLFFFGSELERRIGSSRYLKVFLLSGLAGSVGYILYAHILKQYTPALGASAAIFGVMGCLAIIAPEIRVFIFPFPIPISIRIALVLFALYDFWMMIANIVGTFHTNIANIAHLAGLLFGIYYGRKLRWRRYYY